MGLNGIIADFVCVDVPGSSFLATFPSLYLLIPRSSVFLQS